MIRDQQILNPAFFLYKYLSDPLHPELFQIYVPHIMSGLSRFGHLRKKNPRLHFFEVKGSFAKVKWWQWKYSWNWQLSCKGYNFHFFLALPPSPVHQCSILFGFDVLGFEVWCLSMYFRISFSGCVLGSHFILNLYLVPNSLSLPPPFLSIPMPDLYFPNCLPNPLHFMARCQQSKEAEDGRPDI